MRLRLAGIIITLRASVAVDPESAPAKCAIAIADFTRAVSADVHRLRGNAASVWLPASDGTLESVPVMARPFEIPSSLAIAAAVILGVAIPLGIVL